MDGQPDPARFAPQISTTDLVPYFIGPAFIDLQQPVPICPRTRAAASCLQSKPVIQHFDDQVIMSSGNNKGYYPQPLFNTAFQYVNIFHLREPVKDQS